MELLAMYKLPKGTGPDAEIVLRKSDGAYTPYVTHYHNLDDGGYYHGHYFSREDEARKDFLKRAECG